MTLMGWLHGGKRAKAQPAAPPPEPVEESAPPKTTLLDKIVRWREYYAAERAALASAAELERAREAARARRREAREDEVARSIARRGMWWPGESADEDGPSTLPPMGGLFPADHSAFDWVGRGRAGQPESEWGNAPRQ